MNKHREFCRKAAAEGMVLLENNGVLPLDKNKSVALFGRGQYMTLKSGSGSGDVCGVEVVHLIDAFDNAGISYVKELDDFGRSWHLENGGKDCEYSHQLYNIKDTCVPEIEYSDEIIEVSAKASDTAVVIFSRNVGETYDVKLEKGDYYLNDTEKQLLYRVRKTFERVVVLLNWGTYYDINEIASVKPDAILFVSQGGQEIGTAITDVLFGDITPSGKLADTWAYDIKDFPSTEKFYDMDVNYTEGIYVGYRYFDTFNITPYKEFGFGKSYTSFSVDVTDFKANGLECNIEISVKNTGKYSGKEVVQVYLSKPDGKLEQPYQDLVGFEKTKLLAPDESVKVNIKFSLDDFAGYSTEDGAYILEVGEYIVRVGNSSRNTHIAAVLELDRCIKTLALKNVMKPNVIFDCISKKGIEPYTYDGEEGEKQACKHIKLDVSEFNTKTVDYSYENKKLEQKGSYTLKDLAEGKITALQLAASLPYEVKLKLLNGNCKEKNVGAGVIGCMAQSVEGAAAETYEFPEYFIPRNICADGPAGIRLMSTGYDFSKISREDRRRTLTAYPCGNCFGNSWNKELNREYGTNICEEMADFGIDGWLAPGMNIHRNPLCGRNFEYFSEDPLLSGTLASMQTVGVQEDENGALTGKYVTIKHLALNNKEFYRCESSTEVDERTAREIYLKNFEIAVKQGKPLAIMTSYNRINGVYATVCKWMLRDILRSEWDFKGIVMSDWGANGDVNARPECGNDLNMPGSTLDEMLEGYENGKIKDEDLDDCVARILEFILKTSYFSLEK
ncbi:MAG: glycoside hydrolase family 3 C-terminal domain-containing protein [Clostridia bacterium]|nr:glycoside hydrolase family 3 C-terminal domain-containing protein [Clostridia bacterium]